MTLDQIVTALIYLVAVFVLFYLGKFVYDKLNRRFELREELVKKDNFALSIAVVGYYFGLVIAWWGIISGW
jgi:uncharacterized membrane protein YjfL (UPF0719 family)